MMRAVCFGDSLGIPMLHRHLPSGMCAAIVGAVIRPQYHDELRSFADLHSMPFIIQPARSSGEYNSFVDLMIGLSPDFIFVNSYSMFLPPEILKIPAKGAINIHGALLPQYRGCNPTQWALLNNEMETGVTMHYMDADFDTGDIIAQKRVPILEEDTWVDIQHRIGCSTEEMLLEEIPKILKEANTRTPQDSHLARYWNRRRPEDGYFDWKTWRARDIYNLIRALVKPLPGAFYIDPDGLKVVIDVFVPYERVRGMQKSTVGKVIE